MVLWWYGLCVCLCKREGFPPEKKFPVSIRKKPEYFFPFPYGKGSGNYRKLIREFPYGNQKFIRKFLYGNRSGNSIWKLEIDPEISIWKSFRKFHMETGNWSGNFHMEIVPEMLLTVFLYRIFYFSVKEFSILSWNMDNKWILISLLHFINVVSG